MTPVAIAKAEALTRYCRAMGAPICEVTVALTVPEAYEVLDSIEAQSECYGDPDLVLDDVRAARVAGDPWLMLQHFKLLGFPIGRLK